MTLKILLAAAGLVSLAAPLGQSDGPIPSVPMKYGALSAQFGADGAFLLEGEGWPSYKGTWRRQGSEVDIVTTGDTGPGCGEPGRYTITVDKAHAAVAAIADPCEMRRMLLDRSMWRPASEAVTAPVRNIVRT